MELSAARGQSLSGHMHWLKWNKPKEIFSTASINDSRELVNSVASEYSLT